MCFSQALFLSEKDRLPPVPVHPARFRNAWEQLSQTCHGKALGRHFAEMLYVNPEWRQHIKLFVWCDSSGTDGSVETYKALARELFLTWRGGVQLTFCLVRFSELDIY